MQELFILGLVWKAEKLLSWTMGFSFAKMPEDEWLLISAAQIINTPSDDWADVQVLDRFVPLFGRLIIKCKKGNTFSRYVFNLSKYLDQAIV